MLTSDVVNICGLLVQCHPEHATAAAESMAATPGVEVHARTPEGRMVVTVEDTADMRAHDRIMALHQVPGVLSITLSYHHFETPTPDGVATHLQSEAQP